MTTTPQKPEADLDGLVRLSAAGADWAATTLEQLVGGPVLSREPAARRRVASPETGPWQTALLFETEGALPGLVALLLTAPSRDLLLRNLLGSDSEVGAETRASALLELGNIVASQTVSAMANSLGSTVLLSVPRLLEGDVEAELARCLEARPGRSSCARIESALTDVRGHLRVLLVVAPDVLDEIEG